MSEQDQSQGQSRDPFRARPQVDTDHLSSNAADLAEKAMPDNTGDELAPNADPRPEPARDKDPEPTVSTTGNKRRRKGSA